MQPPLPVGMVTLPALGEGADHLPVIVTAERVDDGRVVGEHPVAAAVPGAAGHLEGGVLRVVEPCGLDNGVEGAASIIRAGPRGLVQ